MKTFTTIVVSAALCGAVLASPSVDRRQNSKTPPVTVKGNAFWQGNTRFYMRGIDYQPGGEGAKKDPIADAEHCLRDIKKFKDLGLNTVRIYTVDNSLNHDECMKALSDAGIYLALDVNSPEYSINRANPHPSYNEVYLQNVFATIDAFAKYDNTLLFFSANEVVNDNTTTRALPYVKATTRDMREYISKQNYRKIPVGYSAADVDDNRYEQALYMNCGSDAERSDFFAFNDYSWCDPSDFMTSGWNKKVEQYKDYSVPIFLSEFGCNTNKREFNEIAAIYSTKMSSVYSGGLVYEYSQEKSNYGIVEFKGEEVEELPDFAVLKKQYAAAKNPSGDGGYKASGSASTCPKKSPKWEVDGNWIPAIPEKAKAFMTRGAGKGVGLAGEGSQWHGTPSTTQPDGPSGGSNGGNSGNNSGSGSGSGTKPNAASGLRPFAMGFVVAVSAVVGSLVL